MPVLLHLPQATIAAILSVASIRMAPFDLICRLLLKNRVDLGICMITAFICVITDPVVGLLVGTSIHLVINSRSTTPSPGRRGWSRIGWLAVASKTASSDSKLI